MSKTANERRRRKVKECFNKTRDNGLALNVTINIHHVRRAYECCLRFRIVRVGDYLLNCFVESFVESRCVNTFNMHTVDGGQRARQYNNVYGCSFFGLGRRAAGTPQFMYINRAADLEKARQPRRALKPKAPH
jgi:hypothetical protein